VLSIFTFGDRVSLSAIHVSAIQSGNRYGVMNQQDIPKRGLASDLPVTSRPE
jgi:hypothetical protein